MRHALGSEHPVCDKIQSLMLILFFAVWGIDSLNFFTSGYSTLILEASTFPMLFVGALMFFFLSFVLVSNSHKAVLGKAQVPPKLIDSGVYAWVRHPMYLGTLLFCLAFLFIGVSLVACAFLFSFFIFYDRMANYEEKRLIEILGEEYVAYQKRVSKWLPRLFRF